jgi:hypothetical protein
MASTVNPFARRESHTTQSIWTYKILTILTWLLLVITAFYYSFHVPTDDKKHWRHTIWGVNRSHGTPFAQNQIITSIYWYVLRSYLSSVLLNSP